MGILDDSWLDSEAKWPSLRALKDGLVNYRDSLLRNEKVSVLSLLFAIGASRAEDCLVSSELVEMPSVGLITIIDGLNKLQDCLVDSKFVGNVPIRITAANGVTGFLLRKPNANTWFPDLRQTMEQLAGKIEHPGYGRNTTSIAVFQSLGLDHASWKDSIKTVRFDLPCQVYRDLVDGARFSCEVTNEGFYVGYRLGHAW